MDCVQPWLILINCLIIQVSGAEWNVIGKVTEYGQNVTLFCYVSNCCQYPARWDMHIPQQHTIFIDVKTSRPDRKYDGKVLKDGYTLVIQNLTKDDLNIKYSCVYGGTLRYGKFLLERDVFKYKTTMPQVIDALTYGESTSISVQDIDKTTIPQVVDASTSGESTDNIVQDATTSPRNLGATSNVEDIINSAQGLLAREVIVYTISLIFVMVFGIGFCLVSFKYMALTKQEKAIIIPSQNPAIPQNGQNIEMENRLYEIINETGMLDDQQVQQMEMSPSYLDVIDDSNIRESDEMKRFEKYKNPCNLMSTAQTHTQEHKVDCGSLMRGDSTSSSYEFIQDSTQDYLNPYQSMIQSEMLPPEISEYLTLAQDSSGDSTSPTDEFIKDSTQDYVNAYQSMIQSEISPPEVTEYLTLASANCRIDNGMPNHQNLRNVEKNAMTKTYENVLEVAYPIDPPM